VALDFATRIAGGAALSYNHLADADGASGAFLRACSCPGIRHNEGASEPPHSSRPLGAMQSAIGVPFMESWEEWQKPYQFGTIAIWPPDEVREVVNLQREEYDPVSRAYCEAHITVTEPFIRRPSSQDWARIEEALLSFHPFEVRYGPLNTFLPYPCIWYEIEPKELVIGIRNALHQTGLFRLESKHAANFMPHMTITEGLSGPKVDDSLLRRLQRESGKGTFLCEDLAYIVPDARFRFRVDKRLRLACRYRG